MLRFCAHKPGYVQIMISLCSECDQLMFSPWCGITVWNKTTWFETKWHGLKQNISALKHFTAKSQSVSMQSLGKQRSFLTASFWNELILQNINSTKKLTVLKAFLGIETNAWKNVSEHFKHFEMLVSALVLQWFFACFSTKISCPLVSNMSFVKRYFILVKSSFSMRNQHWKSLLLMLAPWCKKSHRNDSETFQAMWSVSNHAIFLPCMYHFK